MRGCQFDIDGGNNSATEGARWQAKTPAPPRDLHPARAVFQEGAQAMTAAWMAQFAQGLGFDLAGALARHRKILPYFLERVLAAVFQAEAHLNDLRSEERRVGKECR